MFLYCSHPRRKCSTGICATVGRIERAPREMRMPVAQGERLPNGFILITGLDGIRYAVRPHAVGIIHDTDECHDETMVQLQGCHTIRIGRPIEEVLTWFA